MNWKILLCLSFANFMFVYPREVANLKKLIEFIQRRLMHKSHLLRELANQDEDLVTPITLALESEDLPRDEPVPPGHLLIKPAQDTLASAAKYPHKDVSGSLVYGNLDNLGIPIGAGRVLYTSFRRNNNVLEHLLKSIKKASKPRYGSNNFRNPVIIIIKDNPSRVKNLVISAGSDNQHPSYKRDENLFAKSYRNSDAVNDAREILDFDQKSADNDDIAFPIRRSGKKHKSRAPYYASDVESKKVRKEESDNDDSSDDSSDYEKNPGNPYTVHKNRYKQNWLWNYAMTGDHMNINPKAPQFNSLGPTGADLFFGRKWWYYNQDDYVPFR